MRTTVTIADDLLAAAKDHAAATRKTLDAVFEDALRVALARRTETAERPPSELPTFGGSRLRPGVELDDSAALLDFMEGTGR